VARKSDGKLLIYKDIEPALNSPAAYADSQTTEWRVHFHIPLHSRATGWYENTSDHVTDMLDLLKADPSLCSHLEMETYTWEVLPAGMKERSVVDQLVAEYDWTLKRLAERGLAQ